MVAERLNGFSAEVNILVVWLPLTFRKVFKLLPSCVRNVEKDKKLREGFGKLFL